MPKFMLIMLLFISLTVTAQKKNTSQIEKKPPPPPGWSTKITFDYDIAGNQTIRELCLNCSKAGYKTAAPKEISALQEEDLQKFSSEDVISYYPNPVKEELYLKWELIADKTVTSIYLYALNGQVLKTYNNLEKTNTLNIPFLNYPTGAYLVVLVYNDGEQKTIKIAK